MDMSTHTPHTTPVQTALRWAPRPLGLALGLILIPAAGLADESPGASSDATPSKPELAIYPGFAKSELPASVQATLKAAAVCASHGKTSMQPKTRTATAPHLSVEVIDGEPVTLESRQIDIACGMRPVRRCSYQYVWASGSEQVGYASVQCLGSHDDAYTSYLVTATLDLQKAKKPDVRGTRKDKARVLTSLTFQTDAFPGSHVTAFQVQKRKDDSTVTPPQVMSFDDFNQTDEADGALATDEVRELADEVVHLACRATRACDAEGHIAGL